MQDMPERMIIPITNCKYATKNGKNKVIRIDFSDKDKRTKQSDKAFRTRTIGKQKEDLVDFVVRIDNQADADKLAAFINYLKLVDTGGCINCGKDDAHLSNTRSNDDNEIIIQCPDCLSNKIDSTSQSKDYVKWWSRILMDGYAWDFKTRGFPPSAQADWGTKCFECGGSHDGGGYYFDFT